MSGLKEQNKVLVRRWITECNRRNFSAIEELFAPNCVLHHPGREIEGVENVRQHLTSFCAAFPDLRITIEDLVADDDKVVVRLNLRGSHKGDLMGIDPTGKTVEIAVISITRVEGNKLAEQWEIYDSLGLLQQLGAVPGRSADSERLSTRTGLAARQAGAVA